MSETVLADPQFSIVRVLRPFANYEAVYDGASAITPIMVTEDGQALDQRAGQDGYDPNLVRGVETPLGSRVLLWLPITFYQTGADPPVFEGVYRWQILWRFRNTFDFRQDRKPYHFPRQGLGAPDSTLTPPAPRVVIPAANNTITYIQTEPASPIARVVQNVRSEDLNFGSVNNSVPLTPSGAAGVIQQGVADPTLLAGARGPLYQVHEVQALGDEMLLGVLRDNAGATNWGFNEAGLFPANADVNLSRLFGAGDNVGVYVSVGAAP